MLFIKSNKKIISSDIIGCAGKLPFQTEFIKSPAQHVRFQQLDRWQQFAFQNLTQIYGDRLRSLFTNAKLQHFILISPQYKSPLIGTLMASHDLSGRCYPFFLARIVNNPLAQEYPGLIPQIYQQHYRMAAEFCQQSHLGGNMPDFLNRFYLFENIPLNFIKQEVLGQALKNLDSVSFKACCSALESFTYSSKQLIRDVCAMKQQIKITAIQGWRLPIFNDEVNIAATIFWLQLLLQSFNPTENRLAYSVFWDAGSDKGLPSLKVFPYEILPEDLMFVLDPTRDKPNYFLDLVQLKSSLMPNNINKFTDKTSLLSALDYFSE